MEISQYFRYPAVPYMCLWLEDASRGIARYHIGRARGSSGKAGSRAVWAQYVALLVKFNAVTLVDMNVYTFCCATENCEWSCRDSYTN